MIGLIAGVSVISLIEFLYHLLVYLLGSCSKAKVSSQIHPELLRPRNFLVNQDHVLYQCSKYFFEFIKASSIHGLIYTVSKKESKVGRVFWTFVVIASSITCGYAIVSNLSHAELNPVAFKIDDRVWKAEEVNKPEQLDQKFASNSN